MKQSRASDDLLAKMTRLHPLMIDLSLGRIERLLGKLGSPEKHLAPVVHVAGTNGKGSVTAFLKAMLEAAGLRVGAYTSPHLVDFHERITLPSGTPRARAADEHPSAPISETKLVDILTRVLDVNAGEAITFFEITTAAAFLAFSEADCDIVILEVGLGGRFDTTNVIANPALTIITPVSMDHMDKLGGSLAKIAFEKAGILKSGVAAVIAAQPMEALITIEQVATEIGAPLVVWGRDYDAYEQNGRMIFQGKDLLLDLNLPTLMGRHQIRNAGVAVASAVELRRVLPQLQDRLSDRAIERGISKVRWPARLQRLNEREFAGLSRRLPRESELWLDGGHNEAAGQALAQAMADLEERAPKPLLLVVGMMAQKDAAGFLKPFAGLARQIIAVPIAAAGEAGQDAAELGAIAAQLGFSSTTVADINEAIDLSGSLIHEPVRILICGSLYLAGSILAQIRGVAMSPFFVEEDGARWHQAE